MCELLPVTFHGDTIFCIDYQNQPYTPMRPIVENMGLDWGGQAVKLKANRGRWTVEMISTVAQDGVKREMLSMPVRKLPAWLNSINPKKVRPELRAKIELYQAESDDALWNYWINGRAERAKAEPVIPSPISKRTDPERKALTAIINTWVGMAPIHYASARAQVNAHFGVTSVDALTVAQVKEAIQWVQAKIDALPAVPAPARTPALPAFNVYRDRVKELDRLEEEWIEFAGETRSRLHRFVNELLRVKESTYPELLNRVCSQQNISKDPLLGILQSNSYNAQTWIDAGISEMRAAIRAAKTANRLMLG